jgi:hypothetical protein
MKMVDKSWVNETHTLMKFSTMILSFNCIVLFRSRFWGFLELKACFYAVTSFLCCDLGPGSWHTSNQPFLEAATPPPPAIAFFFKSSFLNPGKIKPKTLEFQSPFVLALHRPRWLGPSWRETVTGDAGARRPPGDSDGRRGSGSWPGLKFAGPRPPALGPKADRPPRGP